MAYTFNDFRRGVGNVIDLYSTNLKKGGLPDFGISEWIAGGPTVNTNKNLAPQTYASDGGPNQSPAPIPGSGYGDQYASNPSNYTPSSPSPAPAPTNFNPKDFNQNPGEGWFWDAADGWKQANAGVEAANNRVRNEINSGFDNYFSQLDQMIGGLGGYEAKQQGFIEDQFGNLTQDVSRGEQAQYTKLDASEDRLRENKATSLRDIASDLRNALQAGQVYLGGLGAGSSSAVDRMSGALAKASNRNSASIMNTAQNALKDLEMKRADIASMAESELSNLRKWKTEQLSGLSEWVQGQRQALQQAQANGQLDRSQSLAALDTQIMNQAMNRLAQIENRATSFAQGLQEWAMSRSESVGQLMANLQGLGQFNQPGFNTRALDARPQMGSVDSRTTPFGYGSTSDEETRLI